jgi:FkbM family methyltransferase
MFQKAVKYLYLKTKARLNWSFKGLTGVEFGKISYSQSGEDIIVQYIFDCLNIEKPSYLDIGAHHPFYLNNTAIFYKKGSRGINIEPDPNLFIMFPEIRPKDINLNIGIGINQGESNFYVISTPTLNTFSKEEAEKYQKEGDFKIINTLKIKTDTISNIINQYSDGEFPDFLSLDAEGVDEEILKSIDFKKKFPKVICIETITFSTKGRGIKNSDIIAYLESQGYMLYADTNINSIFVKENLWIK